MLKDGLPNWKQPLFYYRRMRKMGLVELFVLLLFMLSVGHYLFRWAVFFEKQITIVCVSVCTCREGRMEWEGEREGGRMKVG